MLQFVYVIEAAYKRGEISLKIGVVDVGGGFRGIYAAGVLDYCMDNDIRFNLGIGVSAGSANLASYTAGQRGRNYTFYTKYAFRKQYMSLGNFIAKGSYIDLDYVYSTLCLENGENPLNYPTLRDNPMEFLIVATNALTGTAKYFDKSDMHQNDYDVLKASAVIPFFCKPYVIGGVKYYDGALSDSVPIEKAFSMGCDKVVVILTKPESEIRNSNKDKKIAALIRRKYPVAAEKLCNRAKLYNESVALTQEYVKQGKAIIVAPNDTCGVDTLKRSKESLQRLYEKGFKDGEKIAGFLYR